MVERGCSWCYKYDATFGWSSSWLPETCNMEWVELERILIPWSLFVGVAPDVTLNPEIDMDRL